MRALVLIVALLLAGCVGPTLEPLTNQQIVEQVRLCRENGLRAVLITNSWTGRAGAVECRP